MVYLMSFDSYDNAGGRNPARRENPSEGEKTHKAVLYRGDRTWNMTQGVEAAANVRPRMKRLRDTSLTSRFSISSHKRASRMANDTRQTQTVT